MVEINTTDEMFALLWECLATVGDLIEGCEAQPEDYLLLEKLKAVTNARVEMGKALLLRPTGDAHRDRLIAARLDVHAR